MLDFNPNAAIFSPKQRMQIIISDIGIFIWAAALCYSISKFGFLDVFKIYFLPYLWSVLSHFQSSASNASFRRQGQPLDRPNHLPPTHGSPPSTLSLRRVHLPQGRACDIRSEPFGKLGSRDGLVSGDAHPWDLRDARCTSRTQQDTTLPRLGSHGCVEGEVGESGNSVAGQEFRVGRGVPGL